MGKRRKMIEGFLFECEKCKKVYLCSGECLLESEKKTYTIEAPETFPCICNNCKKEPPCKMKRVLDPSLILLAKLKKGVWISIRREKK